MTQSIESLLYIEPPNVGRSRVVMALALSFLILLLIIPLITGKNIFFLDYFDSTLHEIQNIPEWLLDGLLIITKMGLCGAVINTYYKSWIEALIHYDRWQILKLTKGKFPGIESKELAKHFATELENHITGLKNGNAGIRAPYSILLEKGNIFLLMVVGFDMANRFIVFPLVFN